MGLRASEHAALKDYAKSEGRAGIATVLRDAGLAQIDGGFLRSKAVEAELRALRRQLSSIANNINQMAHHSNILRQVVHEGEVLTRLRAAETLIEGFVDAKLACP